MISSKLTDFVLNLLGERGHVFDPLLHSTVNATVLHGSEKFNVIPNEVSVELDGRLLPGYKPDDMIAELHQIIGQEAEFEVLHFDSVPSELDMGIFEKLVDIFVISIPKANLHVAIKWNF